MKLVFIHGWGFDARFWDALSPLLSSYEQQRVDFGFFTNPVRETIDEKPAILIGHSLGFVWGMNTSAPWAGWIAINSFPRFIAGNGKAGCVSSAVLRAMRKDFVNSPQQTLTNFYRSLETTAPQNPNDANIDKLCWGLDALRSTDITDTKALRQRHGLVLAATNDPLVPPATNAELTLPNADIHWHSTAGHRLPQTDAAWCAAHIEAFINTNFACGA